ncbi:MAG: ABC transporter ATP-binding protein [Clostridiales bacterium]|nr:ABC transporter ATP-binding protein [Clostridiales bacterium]
MGKSDIDIKHMNVTFQTSNGEISIIRNLSVCFREKKITGLIGESGSGKSVIGMSVLRLLPQTATVDGECWIDGENLFHLSEKDMCKIRGKKIALIPQNPNQSLNPVIKIGKQLCENTEKSQKDIQNLLQELGLMQTGKIVKKYSFEMSGGMNQRVVTAMGLCKNPKWIIADEPTKGLDAVLRKQVYQILKIISESRIKSMLLITHDLKLAEKLCDNVCVLYGGEIVEQGIAQEVLKKPFHPYTEGLLNSLPSKGMKPIPCFEREVGQGCIFYSRCEKAMERCRKQKPEEYNQAGRKVRCFLYA